MADDETPKEAPEEEPNPNQAYEQQAMAALAENDKAAQAVVTQMMDGTLTEAEGQARLKAVRDKDTQIGTVYGQSAGGLSQSLGLLQELEKGGASAKTVKKFQKRLEKMFSGKTDEDWGSDLVHELRTGKSAVAVPRAKGGERKRYADLTPDERRAMSHAEVDAMTARQSGQAPSSVRVISKRMGS